MILEIDSKYGIDLANKWGFSGRTNYVDGRHHSLRELKEGNGTERNSNDIFTKNVDGPTFKNIRQCVTSVWCLPLAVACVTDWLSIFGNLFGVRFLVLSLLLDVQSSHSPVPTQLAGEG